MTLKNFKSKAELIAMENEVAINCAKAEKSATMTKMSKITEDMQETDLKLSVKSKLNM